MEVWAWGWQADSRASAKALGGHMFDMNKRRPEWLEPREEVSEIRHRTCWPDFIACQYLQGDRRLKVTEVGFTSHRLFELPNAEWMVNKNKT